MPPVARMQQTDKVMSPHGSGLCCGSSTQHATEAGSPNVIVNNKGAVRLGDVMIQHPMPCTPCCCPDQPALTKGSSTVFVNGKALGRLGDEYAGHIISSGSSNVFAG